ncbi:hypothetical protein GCM10018966_016920 [Streptomyces yanii]
MARWTPSQMRPAASGADIASAVAHQIAMPAKLVEREGDGADDSGGPAVSAAFAAAPRTPSASSYVAMDGSWHRAPDPLPTGR